MDLSTENNGLKDQPLVKPGTTDVDGNWVEDPHSPLAQSDPGTDALQEDPGAKDYIHDTAKAADITPTEAEPEDWKDKVSDTFHDLKDKAGDIAEDIKDKAEDVWDDLKSGKLKEEAAEKIDDLKDGAKNLWNKLTGKKEEPTDTDNPVN